MNKENKQMIKFTKDKFDEDCPRFIPYERDESYSLFDIVDTEKMVYVSFINPYRDINECNRDCNILNVMDYLFKEKFDD